MSNRWAFDKTRGEWTIEAVTQRRILNMMTDEVFDTPTQAARAIDEKAFSEGVLNVLARRRRTYKGLVFVYVDVNGEILD